MSDQKSFFLNKKVEVTKEEYVKELKDRYDRYAHYMKQVDERLERYIKKVEKEKESYKIVRSKLLKEIGQLSGEP